MTAEQLIEENLNETVIKDKLKEIKENARGRWHSFRTQSYTFFIADLYQDINRGFAIRVYTI